MKSKIIIHIGAGKTGTTSLQNNLFSRHKDIVNIGIPYKNETVNLFNILNSSPYSLKYNKAKVKKILDRIDFNSGKVTVFSDERISSRASWNEELVKRLSENFKNAEILITIRNQFEAVLSNWKSHGRVLKPAPEPYNGQYIGVKEFLEYESKNSELSILERYSYYGTIKIFEKYFKKVNILMFEEYIYEKDKFCEKISNILDLDKEEIKRLLYSSHENKGFTSEQIASQRVAIKLVKFIPIINKVPFINIVKWVVKFIIRIVSKKEINYTLEQRKIIETFFSEQNKLLEKEYKINLSYWGYPL